MVLQGIGGMDLDEFDRAIVEHEDHEPLRRRFRKNMNELLLRTLGDGLKEGSVTLPCTEKFSMLSAGLKNTRDLMDSDAESAAIMFNQGMDLLCDVARRQGAIINRQDDRIIAYTGFPPRQGAMREDAEKIVRVGIELIKEMNVLNHERLMNGQRIIEAGIGGNFGQALVSEFGDSGLKIISGVVDQTNDVQGQAERRTFRITDKLYGLASDIIHVEESTPLMLDKNVFVAVYKVLSLKERGKKDPSSFYEKVNKGSTLEWNYDGLEMMVQDYMNELSVPLIKDYDIGFVPFLKQDQNLYFSGHNKRVAIMALQMANQLRLGDKMKFETVYTALMGDIAQWQHYDRSSEDEPIDKIGKLSPGQEKMIKSYNKQSAIVIDSLPENINFIRLSVWHSNVPYDRRNKEKYTLPAGIVRVADAYDMFTSDRPIRRAFSKEEAMQKIRDGKGTEYDPKVVDVFEEVMKAS
jgi:HD-GYP domain-containing protein (c-di-GMP phosphodiesterase class II)